MNDYTYPSVYFSYFFFLLLVGVAVYFCIRSIKDGYWGRESEEPKYRMLQDETDHVSQPNGTAAPRRSQ